MASRTTRREFIRTAAISTASLTIPFIARRFARAGEFDPAALMKFAASLKGRLILPGDQQYNSVRRLWNARYDQRPAIIAQCTVTEDVVRCIEFARENSLVVSVRSGGHDTAGFSTNNGGLVVDLGSMSAVQIDPQPNKMLAQPGLHVGDLYHALGKFGLVAVSGTCPSVGIGGLTTGGGEGWLFNKFGAASDNVLAAEVVTADGKVIWADRRQNSDLLWGVCGGSSNFGVVTTFEMRTIPMTSVTKGSLVFPVPQCAEVLRFCRDFSLTAPAELMLAITYGVPGPADQIVVTVIYSGDPTKADAVIKPLRSFAKPIADDIHAMPASFGMVEEEPPSLGNFEYDAMIPRLSDTDIEVLADAVKRAPALYSLEVFTLRCGVTEDISAYPFRFRCFEIDYSGFWRNANERDAAASWVAKLRKALTASSRGAYVNSIGSPGQAPEAFGRNYDRLLALKNKYDPTNVFRMNQNIKPAA
jgi:FAD/FMN-containing dehydrogenase